MSFVWKKNKKTDLGEKLSLTNNGEERCCHQKCIQNTENGSNRNLEVGFGEETNEHVNNGRYDSYDNGQSSFDTKHKLESP